MSLALLDGDIIAYRSSVTAEEDIDWEDGLEGLTISSKAAIRNAFSLTRQWLAASRASTPIVCLSPRDGGNFRRAVDPTYKTDRGGKPQCYWDVVDALEEEFTVKRIPNLEADDVMGIMATSPKLNNPVIVSLDKDLQTIPGRLFNPNKSKRPRKVRIAHADMFWMEQALTGDPVDGYKGCPKVGQVKAERALEGCSNLRQMWEAVVEEFEKRDLSEMDALKQARLARILRREDYDRENERIFLWHPNPKERTPVDLGSLL